MCNIYRLILIELYKSATSAIHELIKSTDPIFNRSNRLKKI